ncbi:phosphoserine phosphatase SerB [Shewanella sp. WXL01]|uniref:phosphoserine phosphatase SerB n=1 Tax=Shewanella sp. WXL01 TaxID=2709721 RepID=UPI0032AEE921
MITAEYIVVEVSVLNWLTKQTTSVLDLEHGQVSRYQESQFDKISSATSAQLRVVFDPSDTDTCAALDNWLAKLTLTRVTSNYSICLLTRSNSYLGFELTFNAQHQDVVADFPSSSLAQYFWMTQPLAKLAQPGLLVMDMDSTAIEIECIDELAAMAGVGDAVAEVTAQAMRGELDFEQSLRTRVSKLAGADEAIITELCANLPIMPGLEDSLSELKQHQWKLVVASGGFTPFVNDLKQKLGLDAAFANELVIESGTLNGTVTGDVVDAQYKADVVVRMAEQWGIGCGQRVAIGDGANDIPMINQADLGLAFHAKPKLKQQADIAIDRLDMRALVFCLQG